MILKITKYKNVLNYFLKLLALTPLYLVNSSWNESDGYT